ncbi:MAG TPA: thermonuclease family protein [Gammaproteobacteria bacterium]|nr:thermonuclease family protein [Gammaproteobacteria bacterium]
MRELNRALIENPVSAIIGAILLGFAIAAIPAAFAQTAPTYREFAARVTDCYDGDTCTLEIVEPTVSIFATFDLTHRDSARLCDVNAPELRGETLTVAKFSRDRLLEWIRAAKDLRFRPALDKSGRARREKYGRLLGWLVADGVVLNDRLVSEGLAVRYIECAP